MKDLKARLYRLQQRLAISRSESLVILVLLGLFGLGLAAQQFWTGAPAPIGDNVYTAPQEQGPVMPLPAPNRPGRGGASEATATEDAPVRASRAALNLNAATPAELEQLPGIGPVLSERIEQYRLQHGPFQRVEQLTRVRGIGEKTLDSLKPLLAVEVASSAERY